MSVPLPSHEKLYESLYPTIEWRKPLTVIRTDGVQRYACRFCIARRGLAAQLLEQVTYTFETLREWVEHMALEHPA